MFSTQVRNNLRYLRVAQRIREGRHLLPAMQNLLGHPGRTPQLVLANVHERRSFLGTHAADAVAVDAAFVAKQDRTRHFVGLCAGAEERVNEG
jgi:hypothetical protein